MSLTSPTKSELLELLPYLTQDERDELDRLLTTGNEPLSSSYSEWYRSTIPSRYTFPRHIEFLCEVVQKVITGEFQRVCISTPPGHGKSQTITSRVPIYWGETHPNDAIVLTGYSQRFAERNLSYPAREIARERGILAADSTALDEWKLTNGARLVARGVGSAPTGINPISLLIADDPIKDRAQAQSEIERENIWEWWQGSIVQRFWPRTRAIVIATRWHEDDLIGRLKQSNQGDWTFINLPAIAEDGDPLGRMPGEALWPEEKPIDFLESQKIESGEYEFESLFQGKPTPREGSFFKISQLKIVGKAPEGLKSCLSFDYAASEDTAADWTAGPAMYGPDSDGCYYVEPWRIQKEPSERNKACLNRAHLVKPGRVTIPEDPASAGKEVKQSHIKMFAGFAVKAIPRRKGDTKMLTADPFASQVNAGNIRVIKGPNDTYIHAGKDRSYAADYIEELRQFPNGKNDDLVDSSADAFNTLSKQRSTWDW